MQRPRSWARRPDALRFAPAMAIALHLCPRLRPIESTFSRDRDHGQILRLRDTEGVSPCELVFPASLAAILGRFTGARSIAQIAADASREVGRPVDVELIADLVRELDDA